MPDRVEMLREASERKAAADAAWDAYWASIVKCGTSKPSEYAPLQIERLAARKEYSDLKEALARDLLSGTWPDQEAAERGARALYELSTPDGSRWELVDPFYQESVWRSRARLILTAALGLTVLERG